MKHLVKRPSLKTSIVLACALALLSAGTIGALAVGAQRGSGHGSGGKLRHTPTTSPTSVFTASPTPCVTPSPTTTVTATPTTTVSVTATPTTTVSVTATPTATVSATADATPMGPQCVPKGMLHVQGDRIVDASGAPVVLRGAQIESSFNYIKRWRSGEQPTSSLTSAVFAAMSQQWQMNVLRVPLSNWIYALDPTTYMNQLDQVISQANAAGLYVVLDLHDDAQSGSPYGKGAAVPKTESVAFWKTIALHYKANPMVLFDPFNEPHASSWQEWLHGGGMVGGATEVGFQDLVDAIRSQGAQQIIVLEPGAAGNGAGAGGQGNGNRAAETGGWTTFPLADAIGDPNIVYSQHVYHGIADPPAQQDARWGPILGRYPRMYGEWAFLPNSYHASQCQGVPHDQADQTVTTFLNYMDGTTQNGTAVSPASWVAWDFSPYHLIQDTTAFTPTTLDIPWTCGDTTSHAGMGSLVKQHLLALASGTVQGTTPTATP